MTILTKSLNQSFRVTQLCESVAICEALASDRFNWNNGGEGEEK